jgi:ubiquinone/menaquinone biosynthesis C-methylase UbiE
MTASRYVGSELEVFAHAVNWKSYFQSYIAQFLAGDVLEVGAGIGSTTRLLCNGSQSRWICLEPDPVLVEVLTKDEALAKRNCEMVLGSLQDLRQDQLFDSIIYIDVLEHIEDDRSELRTATDHLRANGTLIVLSPAHQFLFTPFDQAIGHFRRYSKRTLLEAAPQVLKIERLMYIDSVGSLASAVNRFLLKSEMPGIRQVTFWDRVLVPLSKVIDPLLGYSIGKSVLAVWPKN